jgi:hypothetical protein
MLRVINRIIKQHGSLPAQGRRSKEDYELKDRNAKTQRSKDAKIKQHGSLPAQGRRSKEDFELYAL